MALQIDAVIAACSHREVVRALFSATLPEAVEGLARSVLQEPLRITVGERNTGGSSVMVLPLCWQWLMVMCQALGCGAWLVMPKVLVA